MREARLRYGKTRSGLSPVGYTAGYMRCMPVRAISCVIAITRSDRSGAPDWIRTSDLQLRRLPLYPTELRARWGRR